VVSEEIVIGGKAGVMDKKEYSLQLMSKFLNVYKEY